MISLIIPTFNEALRLPKSLEKLAIFLEIFGEETEVIVVDDCSTDDTSEIALGFKNKIQNLRVLRLDKNRGKGWAVKNGVLAARGEIVVFTDADFSTPIEELDKLLEKIKAGYDIAIGSRATDRTLVKKHQNFLRESMGRIFNTIVQLLAVPGIKDTQCGFKAFLVSSTHDIFEKQMIYDFGFDVELLFLAQKKRLKIAEVSVLWSNDESSKVNPLKDSLLTLYDLIKIRIVHR